MICAAGRVAAGVDGGTAGGARSAKEAGIAAETATRGEFNAMTVLHARIARSSAVGSAGAEAARLRSFADAAA
jgi:hypothetical protein